MQPRGRVKPLPIPAQQTAHGERVAQAVQPGWRYAGGGCEPERSRQLGERGAGGLPGDAGVPVEGEQRRVLVELPATIAALELLVDQRPDPRAVRNVDGVEDEDGRGGRRGG
jgi:hypothetical protein